MPRRVRRQTKTRGKSEGRPCGVGCHYSFPKQGWVREGRELFKSESVDLERDFWLGRPLEDEGENVAPDPAFWYGSNKMVTYLLEVDGRPDGH